MKKIKIFKALDHLDTFELNRFQKFVNSPYFNKNEAIIGTMDYYLKCRKKSSSLILSKERLWEASFPSKPYNDGRLRKVLSDALKLYENFLCQELLDKKPIQKATLLMEAVEQRKLEALYNSAVKNAKGLTSDNNEISARKHYHRYELEKVYYELTDFDIKRNKESNLFKIISNLDHFYLAEKLKYYCTSISRSSYTNSKIDLLFIDEIKEHIKTNVYADVPIVNIWILIYRLQTQTEEDSKLVYIEFKDAFTKLAKLLPAKEAIQIFGYGQNYCAGAINQGKDDFFEELFTLNKIATENGVLIQQNQLDPWLFRNIVTVALRLKELAWTENFIHEHEEFVTLEFRGNAINYSTALLSFYQKKYTTVLENLNKMAIMDLSYELNTRSLLILTYYEMSELDALSSLLDSFYVYLNRQKDISKDRRELYLQMISFTKKLTNTVESDTRTHKRLLKKLEETKGIASRAWLKEKILERLT